MKKLFAFTLICSICLSFMACGSDDDDEKKDDKEKFVWNGDWNDPNDPNYYGGYYNPIEGDWQSLTKPHLRLVYDRNFAAYRLILNETTGKWEKSVLDSKYKINNTAFTERMSYCLYKIKIEDNIKYLYIKYTFTEWRKYREYKE